MRRVSDIDEILKIIENETEVYIVGAGKDGKSVCKKLLSYGLQIEKFIDEDRKKEGELIEGIEVILPENIKESHRKRNFLLCIGELSFYSDEYIESVSICQQIINKGEIIVVDRSIAIYNRFIEDCLLYDIDLSCSTIKLNDLYIPNFLQASESVRKVFIAECNDLIMPPIFNDYTMIDEGPYEIDKVQVEPEDIVIDAGANLGLFTAYAACYGKKVYAFEPIPKTLELLNMTQKLYGNKINIIKKALSNRTATVKMTDIEYFGQNRICRYIFDQKRRNVDVDAITLDSFVENFAIPRIDFIKADIEGEERNMLLGATKVLQKFAPKLAICTYHNNDDPEILERIIKKANSKYKVIHKFKKLYAYVTVE